MRLTHYKPLDCQLDEYESWLCMRQYWDNFASEYSDKTIEEKLILLGGFVLKGGNLNQLLEEYAKGRELTYRRRIQYCVVNYIGYLITREENVLYSKSHSKLCNRLKCLDKAELVLLLTYELKKRIRETYTIELNGDIVRTWEVSKEELNSDDNLDLIERNHCHSNPKEYSLHKAKIWKDPVASLW